jgi:hypothetical protein
MRLKASLLHLLTGHGIPSRTDSGGQRPLLFRLIHRCHLRSYEETRCAIIIGFGAQRD